ncbi:MAG: tRNA 2-selenouridine(34) synthase MnmH [Kiritimatiellaeota bacterium]|nr:tRNA 2-selenouridine(34) synthase MnmH [Kiritimatiellota bacterium]
METDEEKRGVSASRNYQTNSFAETVDDFHRLVVDSVPLIDTRAPVEFKLGAFETAVNLPLMDDEERRLVGVRFKNNGPEAALKLGHELVDGELKESRIRSWTDFIAAHPECVIYCFRGGQRSRISQQWIFEATGSRIPRIDGGYKAFRRYLLNELDTLPEQFNPLVLAGRTGSGKTILLNKFCNSADLEGLAKHRGSSFGRRVSPQPTQITFENDLAFKLIRLLNRGVRGLLVEDESRNIGRRLVPKAFFTKMVESPIVVLETPFERRLEIIFDEYAIGFQEEHVRLFGEAEALDAWTNAMSASLARIKERLGGARHDLILKSLATAVSEQKSTGEPERHKEWMAMLLKHYYDPMYDYQITGKSDRVVFRGSSEETYAYLESRGFCETERG